MNIDDLENLSWLVENGGEVILGKTGPIEDTAIACDEDSQLAALIRRPDEKLSELLSRLDEAIGLAWDEEIFIDEINGKSFEDYS